MAMASFPNLNKLSHREKLKLADELWQAGVSDKMPVTLTQKRLLESRWASYRSGKSKRLSLAELERRVAVR